jgi:hypothetical protein
MYIGTLERRKKHMGFAFQYMLSDMGISTDSKEHMQSLDESGSSPASLNQS